MRKLTFLILINIPLLCFAPILTTDPNVEAYKVYLIEKSKSDFKKAIAYRESRYNHLIVNSINCIGLYQFGEAARKAVGAPTIHSSDIIYNRKTGKRYLKNDSVWPITDQNLAMDNLIIINTNRLKHEIDSLDGQNVNGITITKSGLLAAAHLGGAGSVKRFIKTQYNAKDMNETSIADYMIEFGGFVF